MARTLSPVGPESSAGTDIGTRSWQSSWHAPPRHRGGWKERTKIALASEKTVPLSHPNKGSAGSSRRKKEVTGSRLPKESQGKESSEVSGRKIGTGSSTQSNPGNPTPQTRATEAAQSLPSAPDGVLSPPRIGSTVAPLASPPSARRPKTAEKQRHHNKTAGLHGQDEAQVRPNSENSEPKTAAAFWKRRWPFSLAALALERMPASWAFPPRRDMLASSSSSEVIEASHESSDAKVKESGTGKSGAIFLCAILVFLIVVVARIGVAMAAEHNQATSWSQNQAGKYPSSVANSTRSATPGGCSPPGSGTGSTSSGTGGRTTPSSLMKPQVISALCPSLVVPSGSEFVFAIKEVVKPVRQEELFNVVDLKGLSLSRVVIAEQCGHPGILVQTLLKKNLAFVSTERAWKCEGADDVPGAPPRDGALDICRPNGEIFGSLQRDGSSGRYVVRQKGTNLEILAFHGNFREHTVNVVNAQGQLISCTERCFVDFGDTAKYYQVRVAPNVDAGLVLCGLLSIDKLGGSR